MQWPEVEAEVEVEVQAALHRFVSSHLSKYDLDRVRRSGVLKDIITIILEINVAFKVYMASKTNNHR